MLRVAIARVPARAGLAMPAWFGESERRRWGALPPRSQPAFVASRALLRELLESATGVAGWDVSAEAGCAPQARVAGHDGAIRVSLSHRLGWVAAAVADTAVGIDVECDRPGRSDPDERAALFLAPCEMAAWRGVAREDRGSALLARWTAKEAWFKAQPAQDAAWDFRRVLAHACTARDARSNVRTWRAAGVHVAVCGDPRGLVDVRGDGLPPGGVEGFWRVEAPGPVPTKCVPA